MRVLDDLLARASLTVETAASLLRRLADTPWLASVPVTAVVPAGQTSVTVRHGLGRAMNGAVVVGASSAATISVDISADPVFLTVRLSSAPLADFTVKLRAF